ncbi:hypothetical protein GP486_004828 [Trichoglossum hirsutum]|uniref:Cupin type-1 domain-containing protein n=1 Tax=Trichoglossum hirsutum TaxID=265104 RepID=A0A9P8RNY4_9PEZI|nr:hypothetical protein GP486_004828 [Trichoglossum hirsutum]
MHFSIPFAVAIFASGALTAPSTHPERDSIESLQKLLYAEWARPQEPQVDRPSDSGSDLSLIQKLILAPTQVDRFALLKDSDLVYDFKTTKDGVTQGKGGRTARADRPCGFNTPHVHPRGAELNIVVQGRLSTSFTPENGARHIQHNLTQYQLTVFPEGALHTEFNPDCTDAVFVAAFPSEDPGVQQAAQTFFGFEDDVIAAALGGGVTVAGKDLDKFRSLIPANVALGVESCLKKCSIKGSDEI